MKRTYSNHARFLVNNFTEATVGDIFGEDEPVTFEIYAAKQYKSYVIKSSNDKKFRIKHKSKYPNVDYIQYTEIRAYNEIEALHQFHQKHSTRQALAINGKAVENEPRI